jgi:hypothetical protein
MSYIRPELMAEGRPNGANRMPDKSSHDNHNSILLTLKEIDFELAYLASLTYEGLKPLSRWEKPLDQNGIELLRGIDMVTKQIRRKVKTGLPPRLSSRDETAGNEVIETIFSRSPAYIGLYEQHFVNTPVDKSAKTQRIEGFLFGYPPCCVEQYIKKPYAPNNLTKRQQKILFHWACNNCAVTPLLLQAYEKVYNMLDSLK